MTDDTANDRTRQAQAASSAHGYCTSSDLAAGAGANSDRRADPLGEATDPGPLVTTSISEHTLDVFPKSVRIRRPGTGAQNNIPPDRSGGEITGFSPRSRSRLRFAAKNAFPAVCSQFGLTYHETWPTDGRTCKAHLHAWLIAVNRILPDAKYLWLMEFQTRSAPHFHVFLTVPPDRFAWEKLASAWVRITSGSPDAAWFHGPQRGKTWIPWEIGSGQYLCKYLDKEAQKSIPAGYVNFGRFWGNSRDLIPAPISVPIDALTAYDEIDRETGEIRSAESYIIRNLGKLADRQTRGYSRFRQRAHRCSYTMLDGAAAFWQIERYLARGKS
jgi:hypothetical protein